MPKVTFMPMGTVSDAKVGETILEVALNAAVPIQHACGGFCACTTCQVIVETGSENLAPMEEEEIETISRADGRVEKSRLACQARVKGDLTIQVVNVE